MPQASATDRGRDQARERDGAAPVRGGGRRPAFLAFALRRAPLKPLARTGVAQPSGSCAPETGRRDSAFARHDGRRHCATVCRASPCPHSRTSAWPSASGSLAKGSLHEEGTPAAVGSAARSGVEDARWRREKLRACADARRARLGRVARLAHRLGECEANDGEADLRLPAEPGSPHRVPVLRTTRTGTAGTSESRSSMPIGSEAVDRHGEAFPLTCANCGFIRLQSTHVLDDPRAHTRNTRDA